MKIKRYSTMFYESRIIYVDPAISDKRANGVFRPPFNWDLIRTIKNGNLHGVELKIFHDTIMFRKKIYED